MIIWSIGYVHAQSGMTYINIGFTTRHHAKTSTPEDPDLTLVAGFPTTKTSLTRKFYVI